MMREPPTVRFFLAKPTFRPDLISKLQINNAPHNPLLLTDASLTRRMLGGIAL